YLAASGVGTFVRGARRRTAIVTILVLGFLLEDVSALPTLSIRSLEDAASELVQNAATRLPSSLRLAALAPEDIQGGHSRFPTFLLTTRGRSVAERSVTEFLRDAPGGAANCFIFIGPSCYRFDTETEAIEAVLHGHELLGEPIRPQ